jgi:LysM repeat protein
MAIVMDTEREPIELETLPEYVREKSAKGPEPKGPTPAPVKRQPQSAEEAVPSPPSVKYEEEEPASPSPQTDVLETLWPGVHHDFHAPIKRPPSFYLTIGFMSGGFIVLIAMWLFSAVSSLVSNFNKPGVTIVQKGNVPSVSSVQIQPGVPSVITPIASVYEVQTGDTLASIALHNYKHVSPRLMDEICQANNLTNANVLNLGQKLILPVYHPRQAATTAHQ